MLQILTHSRIIFYQFNQMNRSWISHLKVCIAMPVPTIIIERQSEFKQGNMLIFC